MGKIFALVESTNPEAVAALTGQVFGMKIDKNHKMMFHDKNDKTITWVTTPVKRVIVDFMTGEAKIYTEHSSYAVIDVRHIIPFPIGGLLKFGFIKTMDKRLDGDKFDITISIACPIMVGVKLETMLHAHHAIEDGYNSDDIVITKLDDNGQEWNIKVKASIWHL